MDLELQRNILESRFFDKNREAAADLIEPLERLLERTASAIDAEGYGSRAGNVRTKVLTTLGNVLTEAGDECQNAQPECAQEYYEKARELFEQAQSQDKWPYLEKQRLVTCLEGSLRRIQSIESFGA